MPQINQTVRDLDLSGLLANLKVKGCSVIDQVAQKRRWVLELNERRIIPAHCLRELPTLYLGAGYDLNYPLALGCKHVIMQDFGYNRNTQGHEIYEPKSIIAEAEEQLGITGRWISDKSVRFDLYNVTVDFESGRFPTEHSLPAKLGVVLGFNSWGICNHRDALDRLVSSGILLDNEPSSNLRVLHDEFELLQLRCELEHREYTLARKRWK